MFIRFILCSSRSSFVLDIFIATAMIAGAVVIVRSFLIWKMVFYLKKHPDKAKEIERYWTIDYKGMTLLDKECDITDQTFYRLWKNRKRATILFHLTILLMLLLAFVAYLFGR